MSAVALAAAPTSRRGAVPVARRILGELRLPPGATRSQADPSGGVLALPAATPRSPDFVDAHRFWTVPGDPGSVSQWFRHHAPAGARISYEGATGRNGNVYEWEVAFTFEGLGLGASPSQNLLVQDAAATGGGTAVRADAEVVWLFLRPKWERVPSGVKLVTVTSTGPTRTVTVTNMRQVRRIVTWVNRLPASQPGVRSCPVDRGPDVTLDFRGSGNGRSLAVVVADGSGCGLVSFRLGSRTAPALSHGPELIAWIDSLLRTRF